MFVTLGSGKAEKALNLWGIKTKELGTDGVEHVRSLEKQILDISLAVSSTDKDTTKFLSTISGGKYQYSKISAILKNYKEILRMQGVLNDGNTKGFADKQVEVQLDTIKRKTQQMKAEFDGLLMDIGRNGGIETLKWLADSFRNVVTGIRELNREAEKGGTNVLVIAKHLGEVLATLAAIKTVSAAIGAIMAKNAEKKAFLDATADYRKNGGGTVGSGGLFADSREQGRIKGEVRAAEYLRAKQALDAETASQEKNTAATNANTTSKAGNANAKRASAGATTAETAATTADTVAKKANTASNVANKASLMGSISALRASTAGLKVFAAAEGVATAATRTLSSVIAAFGGLPGIAAMAIFSVGSALLFEADAAGEAANAAQKHADAMDEEIAKAQQEVDQAQRRSSAAVSIAEAYNKVQQSLANCSKDSEEYKQKQIQLKDMSETLQRITGEEASKFVENGEIKVSELKKYMDKETEKSAQVKLNSIEETKSEIAATKSHIENLTKRIEAMKQEVEAVKTTGKAYSWLQKVIAQHQVDAARAQIKEANNLAGQIAHYGDTKKLDNWIEHPVDNMWRFLTFGDARINRMGGLENAKEYADKLYADGQEKLAEAELNLAKVDPSAAEKVIDEYQSELDKNNDALAKLTSDLANAEAAAEELKKRTLEDTTNDNAKPDNNNYGKERQSKGRSGHHKVSIDYANDPLSAAIRMAAQSDKAQEYHIDEPLLRAIAARESGGDTTIRQTDGNGNLVTSDGVHLGMFQVTQTDADRFGFGSIAEPLNNAMTAVYMLAEKFDLGGNSADLWGAIKRYNGGGDPNYVEKVRANYNAQKQSFNFNGDDFGLPSSFNDDVIAGAKEELGQIYGGSNWRDIGQKVCTTFIQKALVNAGVDETTVDNLSADATNWSTAAGYAFHPYSEVQSGAYVPKPGDIGLTNANNYGGRAGHVVMIGENGEGYYAAAGSGRKSAYYNTNWQTAFADSGIEGVISVNELAGKPYTTSARGGKKKPKTINDFQLDPYAESQYKQQLVNETADRSILEGKIYDYYHGGELGKNKAELAVAELKLASQKAAKQLLEATLDSTQKNIKNALATTHKDIGEVLAKRGTTWEKLVPAERKALADLANDPSFAKQVENQEKIRVKIVETTKAIEEQKMARDKAMGYMSPMERNTYMANDVIDSYKLNDPYGVNIKARREAYNVAVDYLEENLRLAKKNLTKERAESMRLTADKLSELESSEQELNKMEERLAKTDPKDGNVKSLTKDIENQREKVALLKNEYQSLASVGSRGFQDAKKSVLDANGALKEAKNSAHELSIGLNNQVLDGMTNMFSSVLTQGKSFKDAMKDLFNNIGKYALDVLTKIALKWAMTKWLGMTFADGGDIPGKATGGAIPGYASGGQTAGAITGAGTGTSDSILAYIGNKDRFVYLSNGEYVMTAEATQRIGKANLDRMNYGHYATGGALSPTPYVPQLSPRVTRRAQSIDRSNPNARMEQLMQQQTDILRNMGEGESGGGLVVLNTQASSADVLKALQQNPRAVQAILGGQQRRGFR